MANKVLRPFDVVSAPYTSFDGSIKTNPDGTTQFALFMVLSLDYDNITCAKITSWNNPLYLNNSFRLFKAANPFLRIDSYVQLDKIHTLSVETCRFIGYVDKPSRYSIYKIVSGYLTNLAENLKRFCPVQSEDYVSPNRQ